MATSVIIRNFVDEQDRMIYLDTNDYQDINEHDDQLQELIEVGTFGEDITSVDELSLFDYIKLIRCIIKWDMDSEKNSTEDDVEKMMISTFVCYCYSLIQRTGMMVESLTIIIPTDGIIIVEPKLSVTVKFQARDEEPQEEIKPKLKIVK